jgi:hypothetical protein
MVAAELQRMIAAKLQRIIARNCCQEQNDRQEARAGEQEHGRST